ncbi:hypothetical protein CPC08DRAFT_642232, partial [Agrocybe pediades]
MQNLALAHSSLSEETHLAIQNICSLPSELISTLYDVAIPVDRRLPATFWEQYTTNERLIGYRACLLLWTVTNHRLIPREFQLEATIATLSGKDTLIDVGTGYGKTLCMILPCLLEPHKTAMVFSPLK